MVKDGKRFADSGGWGWAYLKYDAASDTFKPATTADEPPQAHDAKCGLACHTIVKTRDYFFTDYGTRVNGNGPRPVLERHDLGAPGREVVRVRVHFDSGAAFGKHPPKGHWVNERG